MRLRGTSVLASVTVLCALAGACADDESAVVLEPGRDAPAPGEPPGAASEPVERRMESHIFELVNEERRERGVEPLEWSDQLTDGARAWSEDMASRGAVEHQDAQRIVDAVEGLTAVGENVFGSSAPVSGARIHIGWMRSDGHRRNVLEPGFDRVGVGVVCTDAGEVYATQRFGRTAGADLPAPATDGAPPQEPIVAAPDDAPRCPGPRTGAVSPSTAVAEDAHG